MKSSSIHFHSVSRSVSVSHSKNHPVQTSLSLVRKPLLSLRAGGEIRFTDIRAKPYNRFTIMRIIYRLPISIRTCKFELCQKIHKPSKRMYKDKFVLFVINSFYSIPI